jgi:hypothetical protein
MMIQIAVREYWNKINEENNSIHLHIRTACAAHKENILKAESM